MAVRRSWGIRARVTAISVLSSIAAMVIIVFLAAHAASASVRSMIEQSLIDRLDGAEAFVTKGEFERAVDHSGADLLQLIGPDGKVIASTANAQGLSAIMLENLEDVVDELDLELDDDDDEDEKNEKPKGSNANNTSNSNGEGAPSPNASVTTQPPAKTTGQANSSSVEDDDDDNDDDDTDEDSDDDYEYQAPQTYQNTSNNNNSYTYSPDDSDDDYDDAYDAGSYDDGADEADDEDDDDDDDDDDSDAASFIGIPRFPLPKVALSALNQLFTPAEAYGAPASSVSASSVMGTPGPFLIMQRKVESPQGEVTMVAMKTLAPAIAAAKRTAVTMGLALSLLLAVVAAFSWVMTGRTLRPVEVIRQEVESITAEGLDQRVSLPGGDPSLVRLVETFNRMLARLEASIREQRRFVSDASHELKSPIASMGLMLEALQMCPEGLQSAEVLDDLEAENRRLSHIVSDLLMLARSDEGRLAVNKVPTDMCDLIFEETTLLRRRCSVSVDDTGVEPTIGLSDPTLLSHAIRNLLDNAARYARESVWISCQEDTNEQLVIRVSDDGPGIPQEDRERVFGRFVRLDPSRDGAVEGTGLGLSLTREIVESLGGTVSFVEPEHGGATAELIFPAS